MEMKQMQSGTGIQMPRYKCHKEVWALKIAKIEESPAEFKYPGGSYHITPADECYAPFPVSSEWIARHKPEVGGYYVVYDDGYSSFSQAKAFEEGYTRIKSYISTRGDNLSLRNEQSASSAAPPQ